MLPLKRTQKRVKTARASSVFTQKKCENRPKTKNFVLEKNHKKIIELI